MLLFGLLNCGVFKALNASARNQSRRASPNEKFLNRETSICFVPGPTKMFRPELPNVYSPGDVKAEASNQRSIVRSLEGKTPDATRFGNWDPVPVFRVLVCMSGVTGNPVRNVPMPFSCHPPATRSMALGVPASHFLPLPNGSSYEPLIVS